MRGMIVKSVLVVILTVNKNEWPFIYARTS